jgi:hypothetical protein
MLAKTEHNKQRAAAIVKDMFSAAQRVDADTFIQLK